MDLKQTKYSELYSDPLQALSTGTTKALEGLAGSTYRTTLYQASFTDWSRRAEHGSRIPGSSVEEQRSGEERATADADDVDEEDNAERRDLETDKPAGACDHEKGVEKAPERAEDLGKPPSANNVSQLSGLGTRATARYGGAVGGLGGSAPLGGLLASYQLPPLSTFGNKSGFLQRQISSNAGDSAAAVTLPKIGVGTAGARHGLRASSHGMRFKSEAHKRRVSQSAGRAGDLWQTPM